jgi:chromosomal replication initiator protein
LTPNVRPALASRLHSGYSLRLNYPSVSTRKEILRMLAVHSQIAIGDEELDAIGLQLQDGMSPMQMRGLLIRWSHHDRVAPDRTPKESKRLIDNLVDGQAMVPPAMSDIAKAIGREMQLTMELLRGPGRKSSVVRARGLAMFLMRQMTEVSYQNIGEYFGGRDHTTVMHACKKTEEDLRSDNDLMRILDRVKQRLR